MSGKPTDQACKYFQLLVNGALLKRGIVMEDQYHSSYEEMIKNTAAIL